MNDLTGFQRDLLYVIAENDGAKGLAIKDEMDTYYGSEINHGRLYPNLDHLVGEGYVEKGRLDDRTNSYSLTDRGVELLQFDAAEARLPGPAVPAHVPRRAPELGDDLAGNGCGKLFLLGRPCRRS